MVQPARDPRDELYEAYLRVPEHQHAEIVNGTLYVMSRPAPRHAIAASVLGFEIGGPFQRGRGGPGGWWILDEPELQLVPKEPVVPDLAGWRLERMPVVPRDAYFTLVPDWVCEVLSRSTGAIDRSKKLPVYARAGVRHVWLIDALRRTLEVLRLDAGRWTVLAIHRDDERVRAEPFEAVELPIDRLWAHVAPPPGSRASEPTAQYRP